MRRKDGTVASDQDIKQHSGLYIRSEVANDISLDRVLADVVLGSPKAGKDSIAGLNSASDFGGRLPDHLREVGRLGVVGVIFRNFIGPGLDGVGDGERASTGGKILAKGAEGSSRVLVLALVGPLLSLLGGSIAPGDWDSAVLGADRVMGLQVGLNIRVRRSAPV